MSIQPAFVEHILCAGPESSSKGFQFCIFVQKGVVLSFWCISTGQGFKISLFLNHVATWFSLDTKFGRQGSWSEALIPVDPGPSPASLSDSFPSTIALLHLAFLLSFVRTWPMLSHRSLLFPLFGRFLTRSLCVWLLLTMKSSCRCHLGSPLWPSQLYQHSAPLNPIALFYCLRSPYWNPRIFAYFLPHSIRM